MSSTKATLVTKANKATLVTKPNVATLVTRPNRATVSGSPSLIGTAVGFWRADQYDAGNDVLSDLSGSGRHARLGSAVGADASDPVRLVPVGGKRYLWLPGTVSNWADTPDHADLDIMGDLDLIAHVSADNWAKTSRLINKWKNPDKSYILATQASGALNLAWSTDGSNQPNHNSTVATGFANKTSHWVRATLDVDNGLGGYEVKFWTSNDDTNDPNQAIWTQLGATIVGGAPTSVFAGTRDLQLGTDDAGGSLFGGRIDRIVVKNGIGGTTVFDSDFTSTSLVEPFSTFLDTTGKTVTINRSTSGLVSTVVDRPMLVHDGAARYSEVADHASLDFAAAAPFSIAAAVRPQDATPSAAQVLLAKKTNLTTGAGYAIYLDPTGVPKCVIADGTNSTVATGPALPGDRRATVVAAVRDPVTDLLTVYTDGVAGTPVTDTTTGAISNAEVLRLGRLSGAGTNYLWGEIFGAGVWNKALAPGDVAALSGIMKLTPA